MRLTVIGCSGSYPGPESAASCYLVETEHGGRRWRILLDLGSGALGSLHRFVDPLEIDAVFISHLHPDHFFDISGYYVMRKYHPLGPQPIIPIWGPKGLAARCASSYGLPKDPGMDREFDFHEYDGGPIVFGPFTVTTTEVAHPIDAFGLRIESGGHALAYSGDTGPCAALVELAKDADLLLAEAAFREGGDNPTDLHLTGRQAAEAAVKAGVGALVLTHIPPWFDGQDAFDEARPVFDGRLAIASTGATYDIGG
jgi:ribonuclease BN (tRNA processing enzyme)